MLYYVDKKGVERFILAFPFKWEAELHIREGLEHLKHPRSHYRIRGVDPARVV
jgi:hypothetical protein